jgi:phosphoglycolate phosphatase-like HAD superfamily hydrolase
VELLTLDFDGVLSDSAPEAWLVTLLTYSALRPCEVARRIRDRAQDLSPDEIRADRDYRRFVEMIPLGNRAEDYAVALSLVASDRSACDQAAFDAAYAEETPDFLAVFHEHFYATRLALRQADPLRWVSLLGPYPEIVAILSRRAAETRLAIATAKDGDSVALLLRHYGIDHLFPEDARIDKQAGRSKRNHLAFLQQRLDVPYSQIVFVDDKVNHLEDVAGLGVRCVLAAWGYNGEREQCLARAKGYRVCTLEDFELQLFPASAGA